MAWESVANWALPNSMQCSGSTFYVALRAINTQNAITSVAFSYFEDDGSTPRPMTQTGGSSATSHTVTARRAIDIHGLNLTRANKKEYFLVELNTSGLPSWDSTAGDDPTYIKVSATITTGAGSEVLDSTIGMFRLCSSPTNPKTLYVDPVAGTDGAGHGTSGDPIKTLQHIFNSGSTYYSGKYDVIYVKPGTEIATTLLQRPGTTLKHIKITPWPGVYGASDKFVYALDLTSTGGSSVGYFYRFMEFDGSYGGNPNDRRIEFQTQGNVARTTAASGESLEIAIQKRRISNGGSHAIGAVTRGSSLYLTMKNNYGKSISIDSVTVTADRGTSSITLTFKSSGFANYTIGTPAVTVNSGDTFLCQINWPSTGGSVDSDIQILVTPSGDPQETKTITLTGTACNRQMVMRENNFIARNCISAGEFKSSESLKWKVDASATSHFAFINCLFNYTDGIITQSGDSYVIISECVYQNGSGSATGTSTMTQVLWDGVTVINCGFGDRWIIGEDGNGNGAHRNFMNTTTQAKDIMILNCVAYGCGDIDGSKTTDGDIINYPFCQMTASGANTFNRVAAANNFFNNAITTQSYVAFAHSSTSQPITNLHFFGNTWITEHTTYGTGIVLGVGAYDFCNFHNNIVNNITLGSGMTAADFQGGGKETSISGISRRNYSTGLTFTTTYLTATGVIHGSDLKINNRATGSALLSNGSPLLLRTNFGTASDILSDLYGIARSSSPVIGAAQRSSRTFVCDSQLARVLR